jgi:hypothetical protein
MYSERGESPFGVVRVLPQYHMDSSANDLAFVLETRYKPFDDPSDLPRAISLVLGREALVLCPPVHHYHLYAVMVLSRPPFLDPNRSVKHNYEMAGLLKKDLPKVCVCVSSSSYALRTNYCVCDSQLFWM